MSKEEAIKMVKAKLECMTRDVSGRDSDCIDHRCDECPLNYEQGNMGEQMEWLRMAIKAIKTIPSEDEKIIRIKKGTLKARTGRYVIYDVEWLKTHFNTTEAKIYGQPQPKERTEEGTETHACDYISRKLMMDMGATCIAARNEDGDLVALGALDILPSATPQPKTGHWTHDGGCWKNRWICSECGYKLYDEQSKYCPNCGSYNGGAK